MIEQNFSQKDKSHRWAILSILTVAQLSLSMGAYSWGPLAPFLTETFGVNRSQIGLLTSAIFLPSLIVALPFGVLVDRYGARLMLAVCLLTMGIPFALLSQAGNFTTFLIITAMAGMGYGSINMVSTKGIMIWFPQRLRATAMGLKQTGVSLGAALGAVLLPAICLTRDWRLAVLLVGLLMISIAVIGPVFYREKPLGMTQSTQTHSKQDKPSLKQNIKSMLSHPDLKILSVIAPLIALSQSCVSSFIVLFFNQHFEFSEIVAGSFLTMAMIAGTIGRVGWGIISDRMFAGNRLKPAVILCFIAFLGTSGLALFPPGTWTGILIILACMVGFTLLGWNALLMTLGAEYAGAEMAGSMMGAMALVTWPGVVIGPPVFGAMVDAFGWPFGWLTLAVICALNTFGFLYLVLRHKRGDV